MGISIVDLDSSKVQSAMVGAVDRVTVGPRADGSMVAYGLIGRATPPATSLDACGGSSSLVAVEVNGAQAHAAKSLPMPAAAIAAAPGSPDLFAALPCDGQVVKIAGDPTAESGALSFTKVSDLSGAAAIAVLDERVWAAGTMPSSPECEGTSGNRCSPGIPIECPEPSSPHLAFVTDGARLVMQSIPVSGGMPITLELPERRETMISTDDPAKQHAQVLHSLAITPIDLVALPGGQYVSVITTSEYYIESLTDQSTFPPTTVLPCLQATTGDWMLIDMASSSVAQRVRTECMLTVGPSDMFMGWACDAPPEGEATAMGASYLPTSIGALFGAR
jgi:hypothetical protein